MYNYNNLWEFLKAKPKNLLSLIALWPTCLAFVIGGNFGPYRIESTFWSITMTVFMTAVAYLAWYRVFLIYKRNKKKV